MPHRLRAARSMFPVSFGIAMTMFSAKATMILNMMFVLSSHGLPVAISGKIWRLKVPLSLWISWRPRQDSNLRPAVENIGRASVLQSAQVQCRPGANDHRLLRVRPGLSTAAGVTGLIAEAQDARLAGLRCAQARAVSSIAKLLAQNALVEAVPRIEQHLHGDAVIHLDVDR